jgi:Flp pilus assembly protein TadB
VSVPESRPPRLTDAERQQLDELEQRLLGQFPDLGGRFASRQVGEPTSREIRVARIVFALIGLVLVVVGGVIGGLGGAAAVLVAVAGTFGLIALVTRNLARARAAVEATTTRRASTSGTAET